MIEVQNLSKKYGRLLAVNDVSFVVNDGEIIGFLGPNGAGKSTIMNILTGYLSMTSGSVKISGYDITDNPTQAKKHIGYLPEIPPLYPDMTVREYLGFIYDLKKVKFAKAPHIDEICTLVGINNVAGRLIKTLSKGYRQRVGFAGALIGNPEVLILDEPTVGLDPRQITEVRDLIKRLGQNHTVILSSHILSEIQAVCDRIIIINRGELIADGTAETLAESAARRNSVKVRVKRTDALLTDILSGVEGVLSIEELGEVEDNSLDFNVTVADGADARCDIISALAEANITLLEISKEEVTLEQTFLELIDAANAEKMQTDEGLSDAQGVMENGGEQSIDDQHDENTDDNNQDEKFDADEDGAKEEEEI